MAHTISLNWPQVDVDTFVPDVSQREVIEHRGGHLRVLAGPGTGKTSVIVAAVESRLRRGEPAGSMIVLTYGRLAAAELRRRLTSGEHPTPVATTFHSLAYRLLRAHRPDLRLMGAPEQESILREIVRTSAHLPAQLEQARTSRGLTEQLRVFISRAQALGLAPGDVVSSDPIVAAAAHVYGEYLDIIGLAGAVDYAELIRRATAMLDEHPVPGVTDLRSIFVDEYQDTDPAQVALLRRLCAHGADVIAVGDPDQSIYGFRGADADGILRFGDEFAAPQCRTVTLRSTRRFGPAIAEVARRVVPRSALSGVAADQVRAHRSPEPLGTVARQCGRACL